MIKSSLSFTKMHGLGNDFVVINALIQPLDIQNLPITALANRHIGIGFDQLLIIEPSKTASVFCRIYNADGSVAKQCGNGLRCVARYLHEEGLQTHKQFDIETLAGVFAVDIQDYDNIRICMGQPIFNKTRSIELQLTNPAITIPLNILSLGNSHAITKVDSIEAANLSNLATQISTNAIFPDGVNVGFMQIINRNHIKLRTFERGAGETCACGSNASAAAVAGISQGLLQKPVKIEYTYGTLLIDWEGDKHPVYMTGSATRVYSGEI